MQLTESMADPSQAENYNFDAPDALDFDAAYNVVSTLMKGEDADVPIYNFNTHQRYSQPHQTASNLFHSNRREKQVNRVSSAEIILFEGIFTLYDKRIRDLMNLKLFILVDDDERLSRRSNQMVFGFSILIFFASSERYQREKQNH